MSSKTNVGPAVWLLLPGGVHVLHAVCNVLITHHIEQYILATQYVSP